MSEREEEEEKNKEEKCPPVNIKIDKESICDGEGSGPTPTLTDQIQGKGLSVVFFRTIDRGNALPDEASLDKAVYYLTAMKELGIESDDLFTELFTIRGSMRSYEQYMELARPVIEAAKTDLKNSVENGGIGVELEMSEISEWKNTINNQAMQLNMKILDRFREGLAKVYGEDNVSFVKRMVGGEI